MTCPCVLAVDDDPVFLRIVESALKSAGCSVVTAGDLVSARAILNAPGSERFTCILIDYQLPDGNGVELLRWLKDRELPASAIMVTASDEQELVRETMVEGACNFLNKPVSVGELRQAVAGTSSAASRRLELTETLRQVETAGEVLAEIMSARLRGKVFVEYRFRPKHECGGDFLAHYRFPDGDEVFLISDVSGHEISTTMLSSFFQGWMTASLKNGDVEPVLRAYNTRTLSSNGIVGSVAVTALRVQPDCLTAWNCGGLPPVYVNWRGRIQSMGERRSSPLGWFESFQPPTVHMGIPPGPVWIRTDGVDSLADSLGASPLAVSYALLACPRDQAPLWLGRANDDVLVARIWPGAAPDFVPPPYFHPLIAEKYGIDGEQNIDSLQASWKTSLQLALPQLPAETVHDVLLGSREALLNALTHGCCAGETASFQVLYNPGERVLRVRVDDPGAGHDFDWRMLMEQEPRGAQWGLAVIHTTASRVSSGRNGAEMTMDYILSDDFRITQPEGRYDGR